MKPTPAAATQQDDQPTAYGHADEPAPEPAIPVKAAVKAAKPPAAAIQHIHTADEHAAEPAPQPAAPVKAAGKAAKPRVQLQTKQAQPEAEQEAATAEADNKHAARAERADLELPAEQVGAPQT